MSFTTSLSGLRGAQTDLSTTANNIANVGTTGFKRSRVAFGDIMPTSRSAPGLGVRSKDLQQIFTQGGYENSARPLDLALAGPGFFVTRDALSGGRTSFTRAGDFSVDANRWLTDSSGQFVQVTAANADGSIPIGSVAAGQPLRLPERSGLPRATSSLAMSVTLPRTGEMTSAPINPADPASFVGSQTVSVVDREGRRSPATVYFARTGPSNWQAEVYVGGAKAAGGPIALRFENDVMTSPASPVEISAGDTKFALDLSGATTGDSMAVASVREDGFAPADFSAVTVGRDGVVTATFADGTTQPLGRMLIADFANPMGLSQLGDARWGVTGGSGPARVVIPGEGGAGGVQSGMLESANVDLTEELVGLIEAQRNFQANAKAIDTANAMTQAVLGIAR